MPGKDNNQSVAVHSDTRSDQPEVDCILKTMKQKQQELNGLSQDWFASHPNRASHEGFLRQVFEIVLNDAVFDGTDREKSKVVEWRAPEELQTLVNFTLSETPQNKEELIDTVKKVIHYSVKTGHPRFINQLFSSVDPFGLAAQWVTDALNPSVYTYEVAPVFTLMELSLLREMRRIVGYPNGEGDGVFCPGGSMANTYGIQCARHKFMPDIKERGLFGLPRLVLFTSEDAHYSVKKSACLMGIGAENLYLIKVDSRGRMDPKVLEEKVQQALAEGALPFMVCAVAGTTVLGAFDPLPEIADICEKYNMWLHVDAAWGGGALMSSKYRHLLQGIERADSVTWNPHKLLAAPQQCSVFLTKDPNILQGANGAAATYLFQQDKFYSPSWDTGDKYLQCGRRGDVFKFWMMWQAKGTTGLEKHIDSVFESSEYFTDVIRQKEGFTLILKKPQCTNVCFWYVPPSLRGHEQDADFQQKLHTIAPKIKERMIKCGSMMVTYQPLRTLPNFFRLVVQSSGVTKDDMDFFVSEIERLGHDL